MKIFLSHAQADAALARALAKGLREEGFDVWLAEDEIFPGDNWAERVSQALNECDAMVALFTENSIRSGHVQWEVSYALGNIAYRRRVIPVVVGDRDQIVSRAVPWILERFGVIRVADPAEAAKAVHEIAKTLAAAA